MADDSNSTGYDANSGFQDANNAVAGEIVPPQITNAGADVNLQMPSDVNLEVLVQVTDSNVDKNSDAGYAIDLNATFGNQQQPGGTDLNAQGSNVQIIDANAVQKADSNSFDSNILPPNDQNSLPPDAIADARPSEGGADSGDSGNIDANVSQSLPDGNSLPNPHMTGVLVDLNFLSGFFAQGAGNIFESIKSIVHVDSFIEDFVRLIDPEGSRKKEFVLNESVIEVNGKKVKCIGAACEQVPEKVD